MQLHPLKLVTVIGESVLKDQLCTKAMELGASGFTYFDIEGSGARGEQNETIEGPNYQYQFVCPEKVAQSIVSYVAETFFTDYAVVVWVTDVAVVRKNHFSKAPE
jgi:nitrogen regulatory protein PII